MGTGPVEGSVVGWNECCEDIWEASSIPVWFFFLLQLEFGGSRRHWVVYPLSLTTEWFSRDGKGRSQSWVQPLLLYHFTVIVFHAPAAMVYLAVLATLSSRGIWKGIHRQYVGHFSVVKCWSISRKIGNGSLTNNLQLITFLIFFPFFLFPLLFGR